MDPSQTEKPDQGRRSSRENAIPAYETKADLPKSDSTKDFDVPADATKG